MNQTAYATQQSAAHKPQGVLAKSIDRVLNVAAWLLFALIFNVAIEWGGIFFRYWDLPGALHSSQMLSLELGWLNQDFGRVVGQPAIAAVGFAKQFYKALFVWSGSDVLQGMSVGVGYQQYLEATTNMVYLFAVRLVVIVFSFPVFLVFGVIGLIDGLSQRDLRRFGGDRESSYFWNRAVVLIKPMFILPFVIYLASPFSIHPNWVILPFAICFGLTVWLSSLKFKKYL